ncbi:MAG: glycosyltransferase family 4 protein, partial [Thaumarchaeota archaeon]|nr:glycosyltransferase family 4 protein [Nitrososphaerota archaeon]
AEEKLQLISSSVALAFPSLCEGFGLVILEAFQQKKPVLVSDIRPMSDIVSHRNTGFVLNPYSEETWAGHMLELAQNNQLASKMGQ